MSETYLPTEQEKQETLEATNKLLTELKQQYPNAEVALVGSLAKGTWIAKDVDADIYVLSSDWQVNYENAKQFYGNGHKKEAGTLKIWACRKYGLDIDLIFANPNDVKSDTLKHAPFFNENLTLGQKGNVIALKAFFKTEGVYGAEMGGITGVAIEELIRQHGTVEAVIEYLASKPDKPFLQDPVLKESRDLLASIIPLRWKQLRNCLHLFLRFQYNSFTKEQFLSLYPKHHIVQFERKREANLDFSTTFSLASKTCKELKQIDDEVKMTFDVFVDVDDILIALAVTPETFQDKPTTQRKIDAKRFPTQAEIFKAKYPDAIMDGDFLIATVPRKVIDVKDYAIALFTAKMWTRDYLYNSQDKILEVK